MLKMPSFEMAYPYKIFCPWSILKPLKISIYNKKSWITIPSIEDLKMYFLYKRHYNNFNLATLVNCTNIQFGKLCACSIVVGRQSGIILHEEWLIIRMLFTENECYAMATSTLLRYQEQQYSLAATLCCLGKFDLDFFVAFVLFL